MDRSHFYCNLTREIYVDLHALSGRSFNVDSRISDWDVLQIGLTCYLASVPHVDVE